MICPHCRKVPYEDEEEDTARSAVSMRLFRLWVQAFDWFTDEHRQVLLDVVGCLRGLSVTDFRLVTAAITGPGLRRVLEERAKR